MKEIKKNFWKNKKILITGHTGFTGIWLTTLLSNYGAKITGISLDDNTQPAIYKTLKINKKVKNIYIDVANFSSLKEVILKCNAEIIIHLAAQSLVQKSYKYSHKTFLTNTIGTLNLLEILKDNKYVKAIFIATTDKVYLNNEKKKFLWNVTLSEVMIHIRPASHQPKLLSIHTINHFLKKKSRIGNGKSWKYNWWW